MSNVISIIDIQENTVNSDSPFDELIVEQEEVKLNIGFNTKYEDASGLIYYNNRYYDSDLGRFISQDAIFEEGGVNLYNFVENDPINHWDILGNISIILSSYNKADIDAVAHGTYLDYANENIALTDIGLMGVDTAENVAIGAIDELREIFTNIFDSLGNTKIIYDITSNLTPAGLADILFNAISNAFKSATTEQIPSIFDLGAVSKAITNSNIAYGSRSGLGFDSIVVRSSFIFHTRTFGGTSSNDTTCTYIDENGESVTRNIVIYSTTSSDANPASGELVTNSAALFGRYLDIDDAEDVAIEIITGRYDYLPSFTIDCASSLSLSL